MNKNYYYFTYAREPIHIIYVLYYITKKLIIYVPVIHITVCTNGYIEINTFISIIRLLLPQIPFDTTGSQHRSRKATVYCIMSSYYCNTQFISVFYTISSRRIIKFNLPTVLAIHILFVVKTSSTSSNLSPNFIANWQKSSK